MAGEVGCWEIGWEKNRDVWTEILGAWLREIGEVVGSMETETNAPTVSVIYRGVPLY